MRVRVWDIAGAERSLSRPISSMPVMRQEETTEMVALQEGTDTFPSTGFPDVRDSLERVSKAGFAGGA